MHTACVHVGERVRCTCQSKCTLLWLRVINITPNPDNSASPNADRVCVYDMCTCQSRCNHRILRAHTRTCAHALILFLITRAHARGGNALGIWCNMCNLDTVIKCTSSDCMLHPMQLTLPPCAHARARGIAHCICCDMRISLMQLRHAISECISTLLIPLDYQ